MWIMMFALELLLFRIAQQIIQMSNGLLNLIFFGFQYHNLVHMEQKVVAPSLFFHFLVILSPAYSL